MIRWRFIISRFIVIILILLLIRWGLGPVARYVTQKGLETATGARVDIASSEVGIFPPWVRYNDVRIADPRQDKSMRNAIEADTIELMIDGDELLRRRWVASSGKITGIMVGSQREASGHFEAVEEPIESSGPSVLSQWISAAGGQFSDQAKDFRDNLETVRRGKEIRSQWEQEYDRLIAEAKALQDRLVSIRETATTIENPLRDALQVKGILDEIQQLRESMVNVRNDLDRLPKKFEVDLASMEKARADDLRKIDQFVPGDLSNAESIGVDLVKDAIYEQIQVIKGYVEGGKEIADYTVLAPEGSSRVRGVNHDFSGNHPPTVLVRHCELEGIFRRNEKMYNLTGIVENLTGEPERLIEPTRARIRLEGPETLRVDYARHRSGSNPFDVITLHWPDMDSKSLRLGKEDDASIAVSGGRRELWVQLETAGENIKGRLVSKQTGVSVDLSLAPKYANNTAAKSLAQSVSAIDRIEIDAEFAGTWKKVDLKMDTNLGRQLKTAAKNAVQEQFVVSREKFRSEIDLAHASQMETLRSWIGKSQAAASEELTGTNEILESFFQKFVEGNSGGTYYPKVSDSLKGLKQLLR